MPFRNDNFSVTLDHVFWLTYAHIAVAYTPRSGIDGFWGRSVDTANDFAKRCIRSYSNQQ